MSLPPKVTLNKNTNIIYFVFCFRSHGYIGPFVYCNIIQILFFIVFEFWDESFNWTPLHDT